MPLRTGLMLLCVVIGVLAVAFRQRGDEPIVVRDAPGCPASGLVPAPERAEQAKAAVLCLLNAERARHGLARLARDASLEAAAQSHSDDMAAQDYFEHDSPAGVDPHARMAAAGYPVEQATTAENLWWGEDAKATPVRAHAGLMSSPSHRATILRPELRAVGIGIAADAPQPSSAGRAAIYTTNFGSVIRPPGPVRSP